MTPVAETVAHYVVIKLQHLKVAVRHFCTGKQVPQSLTLFAATDATSKTIPANFIFIKFLKY